MPALTSWRDSKIILKIIPPGPNKTMKSCVRDTKVRKAKNKKNHV